MKMHFKMVSTIPAVYLNPNITHQLTVIVQMLLCYQTRLIQNKMVDILQNKDSP